ncbi:hypothetical protein B4V02_24095 [Paenibacillus kribbensis]|uniref:Uncharacterized protein n=1 Tax=Paenibacillus kribbensis TaxID=172713 RepID=A0A222WSN2_9BACL|nr:hypothetical protein [Paenibacillus kribbensis]ASR49547.1 hypothetical protein B4V02_24095 [Paenibacillus kribbensis]
MKGITKRFFAATLVAACMLTVPSAFAADDATATSPATSDSANSPVVHLGAGNGGHVFTPNATTPRIENRPISGTTYLADFDIKANYGYVRMYLKNTGNKKISFTINQGSPGGKQKASGSVGPGETYNEIVNENSGPWAVGTFYVNLTSGSSNMSGQLGVRISTDLNF